MQASDLTVHFYGKPKCLGNRKQLAFLRSIGVEPKVHNLLETPWTPDRLRAFFGLLPITECINETAPRIKSGEVAVDQLSPNQMLQAMSEDPVLIKRPLIEVAGYRFVGFRWPELASVLGFDPSLLEQDIAQCVKSAKTEAAFNEKAPAAKEPTAITEPTVRAPG